MRSIYFHEEIADMLVNSVVPNRSILMVGDTSTEMLASLRPSYGVLLLESESGVSRPVESECENIIVVKNDLENFQPCQSFDYVILYNVFDFEGDIFKFVLRLKSLVSEHTKVFIFSLNPVYLRIANVFRKIGRSAPKIPRNTIRLCDKENVLKSFGFEIIDSGYRFLVPFRLLGIGTIINAIIFRLPILRKMCVGQIIVVQPQMNFSARRELSCSVVVPCFNEEENIAECIDRIPEFGRFREIIVVDDGSTDKTREIVEAIAKTRNDVRLISYEQNMGKGYAVNMGFQNGEGDVLMMLDCDMTTPPEELPNFHLVMENGAEFLNGTRIIYPREKGALRLFNRLGVVFFALLISWITQKKITDTFCGTKVFLRRDRRIFAITENLWGDWDLFFTAKRYRLRHIEVAVHYFARTKGETKMKPIRHGFKLLMYAFKGLKVVK